LYRSWQRDGLLRGTTTNQDDAEEGKNYLLPSSAPGCGGVVHKAGRNKMGVRNNLLFVTCHGECCEEGLSYALDLARTMNKEIAILVIFKNRLMKRFDDMMTAVTFAEAGEHETALRHYACSNAQVRSSDRHISLLESRCRELGIPINVQTAKSDVVTSVKDAIGRMRSIDIILLGPNVVGQGAVTARELQRLVKTAARPIVAMTRQGCHPHNGQAQAGEGIS
jgi:hypothetical protein